jgi:hypothetical protein
MPRNGHVGSVPRAKDRIHHACYLLDIPTADVIKIAAAEIGQHPRQRTAHGDDDARIDRSGIRRDLLHAVERRVEAGQNQQVCPLQCAKILERAVAKFAGEPDIDVRGIEHSGQNRRRYRLRHEPGVPPRADGGCRNSS